MNVRLMLLALAIATLAILTIPLNVKADSNALTGTCPSWDGGNIAYSAGMKIPLGLDGNIVRKIAIPLQGWNAAQTLTGRIGITSAQKTTTFSTDTPDSSFISYVDFTASVTNVGSGSGTTNGVTQFVWDIQNRTLTTNVVSSPSFLTVSSPTFSGTTTPTLTSAQWYVYIDMADGSPTAFVDARFYGCTGSNTVYYNNAVTQTTVEWQPSSTYFNTYAYTAPTVPPASAPTGLACVAAGSTSATITWNSVATATGYNILRNGALVGTTSSLTYTDTGLAGGTSYNWTVAGTNSGGAGPYTTPSVTCTTAPPVPTGLACSATGLTTATVTWNTAATATSYRLLRNGAQISSNAVSPYSDTGLTQGTTYNWTVAGVSASGTGDYASSISCTTTTPPLVPPATAPTLTATPIGAGSNLLSWTAPTNVNFYRVFESTTGTAFPYLYSQVDLMGQSYNTMASVDITTGSATADNSMGVTTGIVEQLPSDSAHPIITNTRFVLSGSPSVGGFCTTLNIVVASASYTLAGTTWDTTKEVAGAKFSNVYLVGNGYVRYDLNWMTGVLVANQDQANGNYYKSRPIVSGYTGINGVPNTNPVLPNVGGAGAYIRFSCVGNGGIGFNNFDKDTASTVTGGAYLTPTGTGNVYVTQSNTAPYLFGVTRSDGTYNTAALGTTYQANQRVEGTLYHYRLVPANQDGDGPVSNDATSTPAYGGGINTYSDDQKSLWNQLHAGAANGPNGGPTVSGTATLPAGTYYFSGGGTFNNGGCGGEDTFTMTGVYTLYYNTGNTTTYFGALGTGVSYATIIDNYESSVTTREGVGATVKVVTTQPITVTPASFGVTNPGGGSGCSFSATISFNIFSNTPVTNLVGYMGSQTVSSSVANVWIQAITKQAETGVLSGCTNCPEATKSPSTSQFTWAQIANDQQLVNVQVADNGVAHSGLQAFIANQTTQGRFIDTTVLRLDALSNAACDGAILSVAVSRSNTYPWDTTQELANLTATITAPGASDVQSITVDWNNGLLSNAGTFTFGSVQASAGGGAMSIGSAGFLSSFPPTMIAGGSFYIHWNLNGGNAVNCGIAYSTVLRYNGGTIYTDGGTAWTQVATGTLSGWVMNVYGGVPVSYTLTTNTLFPGGAYYAYICEVNKDANPQQYNFSSSFGGRAKATGYQAVGTQICGGGSVVGSIGGHALAENIQEWRIGYEGPLHTGTGTLTVTFDTGSSSRNLVFIGTFAGIQPTHLHVGSSSFSASGYNGLVVYRLFTTDDFFTRLSFTTYECANDDCTTFGNVSTANYLVTICPGTFQRQLSGTVNNTGQFNFTGQDLPGCLVQIDLSGTGYAKTTYTQSIGSSGTYVYTLGVYLQTTSGGSFTLAAATISFTGNYTRIVPDAINASIVRTRQANLYVDCVKLDPMTGAVRSACTIDSWPGSAGTTYNFKYPTSIRIVSNAGDTGVYVVYVINATGAWYGSQPFCIGATWSEASSCSAVIGNDLKAQLAVDSLNELTAAQRDLSSAKAMLSETSVRQHYLAALDFALAPFADCSSTTVPGAANEPGCTIPNLAWWYLGTLILAGVGISKGRRLQ